MRHTRPLGATLAVAALVLLGGCGSDHPAPQTAAAPSSIAPPAPTASASAATSPSPRLLTAAQVIEGLKAAGVRLGGVVDYTEATDPNHKIGTPNGYTSKTAFTDARVSRDNVLDASKGSVELGGSVEVFRTDRLARARGQYILGVSGAVGGEVDILSGAVLLRLSPHLKTTAVEEYRTALAKVTTQPAQMVE